MNIHSLLASRRLWWKARRLEYAVQTIYTSNTLVFYSNIRALLQIQPFQYAILAYSPPRPEVFLPKGGWLNERSLPLRSTILPIAGRRRLLAMFLVRLEQRTGSCTARKGKDFAVRRRGNFATSIIYGQGGCRVEWKWEPNLLHGEYMHWHSRLGSFVRVQFKHP